MRTFLPEWHPQWGVLLAWPDSHTDWVSHLEEAQACYLRVLASLLDHQHVALICRNDAAQERVLSQLRAQHTDTTKLHIFLRDYDDTWARDFGPLAVQHADTTQLLDYTFTGWGGKFEAARDNALNASLPWQHTLESHALVLEGGAVETDGQGRLLTTRFCLRNPNRNPQLSEEALAAQLREQLGIEDIWWLDHGELAGDDTDAHIDTLARFVDEHTIAYVQCNDTNDEHYEALNAMETQLAQLAKQHGLSLVPLPLPNAQFSAEGYRLPATYANFLITNEKILLPTYGCATDNDAIRALQAVAGARTVEPIDCRVLIEQHGSLHCITMQLPAGALR